MGTTGTAQADHRRTSRPAPPRRRARRMPQPTSISSSMLNMVQTVSGWTVGILAPASPLEHARETRVPSPRLLSRAPIAKRSQTGSSIPVCDHSGSGSAGAFLAFLLAGGLAAADWGACPARRPALHLDALAAGGRLRQPQPQHPVLQVRGAALGVDLT